MNSDHHFHQLIHYMSFIADIMCREIYRSVTDSLVLLTKWVILLEALKDVKTWAIGSPRTPLESICSLKTHKWAVTHWASTYISLEHDHTINTWMACGFCKTHLWKDKESLDYKESQTPFPLYAIWLKANTLFHEYNSLSESFLIPPTGQHSCRSDLPLNWDTSEGQSSRQRPCTNNTLLLSDHCHTTL